MDSSDALYNRVYSLFSRLASNHDWNHARYERAVKEGLIVCESEQQADGLSLPIQVPDEQQDKENQPPQENVIQPSPAQLSKNIKPSQATPQQPVSGSPSIASVHGSPFSPASLPTPPPRVMVTGRSTRRKQRFDPQPSEEDVLSQQENGFEDLQQSSVKPSLAQQGIEEEKEAELSEMNNSISLSQSNTSMRGTRLSFSAAAIHPLLSVTDSANVDEASMNDEFPSVVEDEDAPMNGEPDVIEPVEIENHDDEADKDDDEEPFVRSKKPKKKKRIIEESDEEDYEEAVAHIGNDVDQDSESEASPPVPLPIPLPSPTYEHQSHESIEAANLEVPEYNLDDEVPNSVNSEFNHADEIEDVHYAGDEPVAIDQNNNEAPEEVEEENEEEEEEEEEFVRPKKNHGREKRNRRIIIDDDDEEEEEDIEAEEGGGEMNDDEAEEADEDEIAREEEEANRNNSDDEEQGESCESSSSSQDDEDEEDDSSSESNSDSSSEDSEEDEWQSSSHDEDYEEEEEGVSSKGKKKSQPPLPPAPKPLRNYDKKPKVTTSASKNGQKGGKKQQKKVIAIDSEEEEEYNSEDRDFIASEDDENVDDDEHCDGEDSEQSYEEDEEDSEDRSEEDDDDDDDDCWSNSDDDCPSRNEKKGKKKRAVPVSASKSKSIPKEEEMSKVAFSRKRVALFKQSYSEFNERIFSNRLPIDPALVWSKTLRKTAGICVHRGCDLVRIELSEKVCDTYQKMRETLAHEMCHAAVATIDRIVKAPSHGKLFHKWGKLVTKTMPQLGAVTTCHNYDIFYKFRYQCSNDWCKKSFGRHSDSIDVNKHVCSRCGGSIIKLGRFNADGTPAKERVASGFALYVKQQYSSTKASNPLTPHKDIMKLIAAQYQSQKSAFPASASSSIAASSVSAEQAELERQMIAFNELAL